MKTLVQYAGLGQTPESHAPLHLAIGMFDGLHLGHHAVIDTALRSARESGGKAAVLTFWPHPSALFRGVDSTPLIMAPETKAHLLERWGIDALITQKFTPEFAAITAEDFLPMLKHHLPNLTAIYVGENWRFGQDRRGDVAMLVREAKKCGLSVLSIPRVNFDGEAISSTRIRRLLCDGEIAQVNALLGYAYFSEGNVDPGKGLGRKIGFPTLNLNWTPDLQPRLGVYAVRVGLQGSAERYPAVANFGLRPTVENAIAPRLEVHVLGECSLGTGDALIVEWKSFLRAEMKFADVDALRTQIAQDREQAKAWFGIA